MGKRRVPRIERMSLVSIVVGVALSVVALSLVAAVLFENHLSDVDHKRHFECAEAAYNLMDASDDLTAEARLFVATGRRAHAENYVREAYVDKTRDAALDTLTSNSDDQAAISELESALDQSRRLSQTEQRRLRGNAQDG